MTEPSTIPLSKLTAWTGNVRKTDPAKGLDELAASIAAHGLLQSLVVRKPKRGKPAVVAGRRRLLALRMLAEAGTIDAEYPAPCQIIGGDVDAAEISLVENTLREPMHPADEFEAFRDLADGGLHIADIAARFGVTSTVVEKRLKLARVSPAIIAAFREGELSLEAIVAFASVEDHAAQEQVLDNLRGGWTGDADDIRCTLTEDEIAATDKRVRFLTLDVYEAAGGGGRRDLFADDESGVKILDPVLLDRLVTAKLQSSAEALRAEGWSWIEPRADYDWSEWNDCKRCHPESVPLSDEQAAELDNLHEKRERPPQRLRHGRLIGQCSEVAALLRQVEEQPHDQRRAESFF
jgi:ParB family chromosome partitioning protein